MGCFPRQRNVHIITICLDIVPQLCKDAPSCQIGEALLDDGIVWVHPECRALNDAESTDDKSKEGWDLEWILPAQLL